ncbi:MAG TPA: CpaD family pilus assembly lipoprotein [Mesorhizobium sp.]|jgi:pilus assembly protein CpaD
MSATPISERLSRLGGRPSASCAAALLAILASGLLAGCANRDSVVVGAIPDDYRTNHPIIIGEKQRTLDLAVGASDRGATRIQKQAVQGFLADYDKTAAPVLSIVAPSGSSNAHAANNAAKDFAQIAYREGVPDGRVVIAQYQAGSPEVAAPVRLAYSTVAAQTNKCGRWPADMLAKSAENKHYANFGCSYQNNLAAQVANPNDFLGPRKPTEIDAENRSNVIDDYRQTPDGWSPETEY